MHIYIEDNGFAATMKSVSRCRTCFPEDILHFHMLCRKGFSLMKYGCIFWKRNPGSVEFTINVRHLSRWLILLVNSSPLLSIAVEVDHPLTDREYEKICRIHGIVKILDSTGGANRSRYDANRFLLWQDGDTDLFRTADIYRMVTKDSPVYQCNFSSCLGKTLYISANGDVSFCPRHIEESRIGRLENLERIFENEGFLQVLAGAIVHREQCRKECALFPKCKGGCVFAGNCGSFQEEFACAAAEIQSLCAENGDPARHPFYKELAILDALFCLKPKA